MKLKLKNDVEETKDIITDNLFKAKDMNYTLQTEIEYVRENYYINESDAQSVRQFENEIQSLISVYDDIFKKKCLNLLCDIARFRIIYNI